MKKLVLSLLVLFLLSGCGKPEPIGPPETMSAASTAPILETADVPTTPSEVQESLPEPEDGDLVKVRDYLPQISQELRYATQENFTGQVIYEFQEAYLRYGTLKKLRLVLEDLETLDLGLKIWDAYRPASAQFTLWQVCPDPAYVANPNQGFSSHSRGNTLDLTLVDREGQELEMPTGFDDFSPKADRNYSDCTQTAAANAQILELLMEKHGFTGYFAEWWHYSDTQSYPVQEDFS